MVGMRLSVVAGGAMTERSEVAGGSITPPERPSSREVTPGPVPWPGAPGALSGEAVGGSVEMFWLRAISRTWSRQPSAAARPGVSSSAIAAIRAGISMCMKLQTAPPEARLRP